MGAAPGVYTPEENRARIEAVSDDRLLDMTLDGIEDVLRQAMARAEKRREHRAVARKEAPPYGTCSDCNAPLFRVGSGYECAVCNFKEAT